MEIIKDIATTDYVQRTEITVSYFLFILPKLIGKPISLSRRDKYCEKCGETIVAEVLMTGEGEVHLIDQPCTRLVLGIHPAIREAVEKEFGNNISFGMGESQYLCQRCFNWLLPEFIADSVPAIREAIERKRDPIIDSGRQLIDGKGCWITITEFPMDGRGRFINYQTNFQNFVRILNKNGLVDNQRLAPHLNSF
ncbi:hypothetical protein HY797_03510 [Candidatus Falkowbacteria bacterium]|nr:hypothetical protein [Candidatus Falkowbacteria bacterium]